ncbi:TPA: FAD-dependent oxidoreductase [Burkholderia territorii]|uniref:NAD(P)/FAD-dependent oxidoreductase n=1 Tax=Burkholderia territorii TaxID=1503055 RepID=UPI00075A5D1C|nr:FAD-dependent oxidoreductase [Burkholderia territorii]KVT89688.1 amino acid dehydrogenase [Burkholderia territorii]TXG03475.1 FAD-dependent oxidoreductase [Burkholderia territorii]HDR8857611.1 FAD-dependent oxidoreductase [Burkholderia territorii]HDR8863847.1 FAD-dependent oxidoreductase [Burkholderia territorii]HDR8869820.1 FAD-dependent oxidoreductase [Burkholderia territorii]
MADIAIVGAGFIGLGAAAWLQRDGHRVTLFDPAGVGRGASFGNAATFAPYGCVPVNGPSVFRDMPHFLFAADSPLRIRWPYLLRGAPWLARFLVASAPAHHARSAGALAALLSRAADGYAPLLASMRLAAFVRPRECLYLYARQASFDAAQPSLALRRRLGVPFDTLDADAIRRLEPALAPIFTRGVLFHGSWHFSDPCGFLGELFAHLATGGATLERTRVDRIEPTGDGVNLHAADAVRSFDHVVIAAGARSRALAAACGDTVPLDTERGYHVQFAAHERIVTRPVGWAERGFYMTPLDEGLRAAGTVELGGFDARMNRSLVALLTRSAREALPSLGAPTRSWLGFRPTLPDGVPVIGRARRSDRVIHAFGHQHLGVTLAGITGRIVADLVAQRAPPLDLAPYRAARF